MAKMVDIASLIQEAFKLNKEFILLCNGSSMEPLLFNGDSVTLINEKTYKKNDIILYKRSNNVYVLHRIYKIKNDILYLVGDHQTILEFPIYFNQVIAKAKNYIKNGKIHDFCRFKYKIYCILWKSFVVRKIYFKFLYKKSKIGFTNKH